MDDAAPEGSDANVSEGDTGLRKWETPSWRKLALAEAEMHHHAGTDGAKAS